MKIKYKIKKFTKPSCHLHSTFNLIAILWIYAPSSHMNGEKIEDGKSIFVHVCNFSFGKTGIVRCNKKNY